MKRIKKYITLAIFLSFAFISKVSAEVLNVNVNVPYGTVASVDFSDYTGVNCDGQSNDSVEMVRNGSDYIVQWKSGVEAHSGKYYFQCSFDSYLSAPAHKQPENKTVTVTVKYGEGLYDSTVGISLVKDYYESIDVLHYLNDFGQIDSVTKITGGLYDSGKNYVDISCPSGQSDMCIINLKRDLPRDTSKRWAMYKVKYKTSGGFVGYTTFDIEITSAAAVFAYPGDYGTCNFGREWEKDGTAYKQKVDGATINLPICTADNSANPLLEFKGWTTTTDDYNEAPDEMMSDVCVDYIVSNGGTYTHDPKKSVYISCYASSEGIILIPNGGTISNKRNYIKKDDVIYVKQDGSVVLPEPTKIPDLYNLYGTGRFEGWVDTEGNVYAAGTTVNADGERYMATYSTGQTIAGEDVNQKMVYVNETSPYVLSGTAIESCVSTDTSKVAANMSGGECFLTGVKDTGTEYVDVVVKTMESTRTLKVRVVSREGQWGDDWQTVIIDPDDNTDGENQDGYYENEAGADVCNSYTVKKDVQLVNDVATYGSFGLDVSKYEATSKCNNGNKYLALCMDPGRPGPATSDTYQIDKSFKRTNDFGKLVTHIVRQFVASGETNDSNIVSANIALRIIEYYSPEELATSNNGGNGYLSNALSAYSAIAADLSSACPVLKRCSETDISNALKKSWTWHNTTILNQTAKYLAGYDDIEVDEDPQIQNETKRTSSYDASSDYIYHIKYEGKLTFPSGMSVNDSDISADCGSIPGVSNCSVTGHVVNASVYEYTFTYDVNLRDSNFYIPGSKDEKNPSIKVNADNGVTAANVFVIKTINDNKQRMVIFNTEDVDLKVMMPVYVVCDMNKEPFVIGGPGFRSDLFKAAGCCQFLTDETDPYYVTYCTADCIQSNFVTTCKPNFTPDADVYTINEAYKANGRGGRELNYSCIVDVTSATDAIHTTNNLADASGNYYALMSYHDNQYCTVSCKEDWDISTASFENFTGKNAVIAGQFFSINTDMFIGGSRTCVTTYIDHAKYKRELTDLSKSLTDAWKTQSEYSKVYSELKASQSYEDKTYYTYTLTGSEPCDCVTDSETGTTTCDTCYIWSSTPHTCRVYSISTNSSASFASASWNGQYATSTTDNISTSSLSGVGQGSGSKRETAWNAGSTPSKYSSSCTNCDGYCKDYQNYEYLMDNVSYKNKNVKETIRISKETISSNRSDIYEKAIDMTSCQNFMLKNTSSSRKNSFNYDGTRNTERTYDGNATITGFVSSSKVALIDTKFEPSGSYRYDEREFMALLGRDNVIETHNNLNAQIIESYGKNVSSFNNDCVDTGRTRADGSSVELCKNKLTTTVYNTGSAWSGGSNEAKQYDNGTGRDLNSTSISHFQITLCNFDGGGYEYSAKGNCDWSGGVVSYYQANYFKQTLENSSFYRNKGIWVTNDAADIKQHADNFVDGVRKLGVKAENVSLFGQPDNTFPVGITTPRNMYQYAYTFADIGYFSDGTTGRIMGNAASSLVAVNKHACFYEVDEDICVCCGDPILWETYESSGVQKTEDWITQNGYNYKMSSTRYDKLSSQYGFTNSSVSLYDLDGDGNGLLSGNWSTDDMFTYQTNRYSTDKGHYLAGSIIEKGESIYNTSNSPEYSYTINPTTMSLIKEYNGGRQYGYTTDDLVAYGISNKRTAMDANVITINTSNVDKVNTFSHYGSKFLEDFMGSYVTDKYKDKVLTERNSQGSTTVCSVDAGPDAANKAYDLVQKKKCRWVDYVQTTPDGNKIRLAFK